MTDQNNLARKTMSPARDDDPLEELARIVSGGLDEFESGRRGRETGENRHNPTHVDDFSTDLEAELAQTIEDELAEPPSEPSGIAFMDEEDLAEPQDDRADGGPDDAPVEEVEMSLEDQLMAELENRAVQYQQPSHDQQPSHESDEPEVQVTANEDRAHEIHAAPVTKDQDEVEAEEEIVSEITREFERELSISDPYARQLTENLRITAAENSSDDLELTPEQTGTNDIAAGENEPPVAPPRPAYQRANLDLSDAFRNELQQIASTKTEHLPEEMPVRAADTSADHVSQVRRQEEFARVFEEELQIETAEAEAEPSQADPLEWIRGDAEVAEEPGPPPVLKHTRAATADPAAQDGSYEFADDDLFSEFEYERQPEESDEFEEFETVHRSAGRRTGYRMALGAFVIALLAGGGAIAYGYLTGEGTASVEPPIIRADVNPVKVKPDDPGGTTIDNQDKAAYEKVTGEFSGATRQEQLLKTAEQPVIVSAIPDRTEVEIPPEGEADGIRTISLGENSSQSMPFGDQSSNADGSVVLAPRKVRTVVVKPDGTVVTPVDAGPSDSVSRSAATDAVSVRQDAASAGDGTIDGARSTGEIAVPVPRPQFDPAAARDPEPTNSVPIAAAQSATETGLTNAISVSSDTIPQTAAASANSIWAVQVASRRSAEDAQQTFQSLRRDYPDLLGDREMAVQRAEVDGRGVFFRVRVMAESQDAAVDLCTKLKSAGGSCFVTR